MAPLVIAPGTTAGTVDSTLQCMPSAPLYTVRSGGAIWLHEHREPESGTDSWTAPRSIGTGFGVDGRRVAAPGGVIYTAYAGVGYGELRRGRWNGTGWDTFAGGAQHEAIDNNPLWTRFVTPEYRNRITADADGYLYTIEPDGYLHWRRWNPTTRTMAHGLISAGWSAYDLIVATGRGVIYARRPDGSLWRHEYHADAQRIVGPPVLSGDGWGGYSDVVSPGGDLLYGVRRGDDTLWWYRYDEDTGTWVREASGLLARAGWPVNAETLAPPDACTRVGHPVTAPSQIDPLPHKPVTLLRSADGHVHYSYVDDVGRAVYGELADIFGGRPAGLAVVPGLTGVNGPPTMAENANGRVQILAQGLDSEIRTSTRTAVVGQWETTTPIGGFVIGPPALARTSANTLRAYAVDQDGGVWARVQIDPNGPMTGWQPWWMGFPERQLNGSPLTTVRLADRTVVFGLSRTSGIFQAKGFSGSPAENWQSLGGTGFVGPLSAVVLPDNTIQVFATGLDGVVSTQLRDINGFSRTWTPVSSGFTAAGPPSAILAPDGLIKIVARGTDGFVHYTSQTAAGSSTFAPWQEITNRTDRSGTDPTALAVPASNTWVVAYRNPLDIPRLRRYQPSALLDTSDAFVDIPLTPPA